MSIEESYSSKSTVEILCSRLTAIGFVVLILGANAWLALGLVGESPPQWLKVGALVGVALVSCGGVGFGSILIWRWGLRLK